jgi:hypothetical protein
MGDGVYGRVAVENNVLELHDITYCGIIIYKPDIILIHMVIDMSETLSLRCS